MASPSTTGSDQTPASERLRSIHTELRSGNGAAALRLLADLEGDAQNDARLLQAVAECYTHATKHEAAYRCQVRASVLAPFDPRGLYNRAAAAVAVGRIDEAEALFSRVIELNPADAEAWQNRSTLRRQTPGANHIEDLERMLSTTRAGGAEVALSYALAKELEDLGQYAHSFAYLERGARARRRQLSYRVEMDLDAITAITNTFTPEMLRAAPEPSRGSGPIFVLGLPRSGTTLVDRILSSHSAVESLGELNDLPFAVMHAAGPSLDKNDLIRRAANADFGALGREYRRRIAGYGSTRAYVIDKTPMNYLYLGLIRLAMPEAKIIHLRRHPMDSCYAMYKTLFRMGYPFSYEQTDLGRYFAGYQRLMTHWRDALPGGFLDVDYEALVQDQERVSRTIIEWCGLDWEPQCAASHLNPTPAATASAAQVREPIHARSIGNWRRYEVQLTSLAKTLQASGVKLA